MLKWIAGNFTHDSFRSIPLFFFLSFVLLYASYAKSRWPVFISLGALLLCLLTPRFWSIAIEENYLEFPLGVSAMALWLMINQRMQAGLPVSLLAAVISMITVGLKSEGIIIVTLVAVIFLVLRFSERENRSHWFAALAGICVGSLAVLLLHTFGVSQINPYLQIENVSLRDLSFHSLLENAARFPRIVSLLYGHYFEQSNFGMLLPLTLLSIFLNRRDSCCLGAGLVAISYLVVISAPFVVSNYNANDFESHIRVVADRLVIQVFPLCVISIGGGLAKLVHLLFPAEAPALIR